MREYQVVNAGAVFIPGLGVFSPLAAICGPLTQGHLLIDVVGHLDILIHSADLEPFGRLDPRDGYRISHLVQHVYKFCYISRRTLGEQHVFKS